MITLIAAINHNNLLGKDNTMPWYVKEDLQHFKQATLHKDVLMGRKTYESLPVHLNDRNLFVLTNQTRLSNLHENVTIIHDLKTFINKYIKTSNELMVAGGASIYEQVLPYADRLVLSLIDDHQHGDAYFPTFSSEEFMVRQVIEHPTFIVKEYTRK